MEDTKQHKNLEQEILAKTNKLRYNSSWRGNLNKIEFGDLNKIKQENK